MGIKVLEPPPFCIGVMRFLVLFKRVGKPATSGTHIWTTALVIRGAKEKHCIVRMLQIQTEQVAPSQSFFSEAFECFFFKWQSLPVFWEQGDNSYGITLTEWRIYLNTLLVFWKLGSPNVQQCTQLLVFWEWSETQRKWTPSTIYIF